MPISRSLFFVSTFLFSMTSFAATPTDIKLVVDSNYPPYQWKEKDGKYKGIEIEAAMAIFDKAGVKYEIINEPIERNIEQIKRGENYIGVGFIKTEERLKFSIIDVVLYVSPPVSVAVNNENNAKKGKIKSGMKFQEMLKSGNTLGLVKGYSYTTWADKQIQDPKDKEKTSDPAVIFNQPADGIDNLHALVAKGRFDMTLTYADVFKWWADHNKEDAKKVTLMKVGDVPQTESTSNLIFPKNFDQPTLKKLVSTAEEYRKSPEYKKMLSKYVQDL